MKHLFTAWQDIELLVKNRHVVLFLDYDGTLTPIVERPEMANLLPSNRKRLEALSKLKNVKIVIISGRALKDVKRRVGVSGLTYAGNHGLEFEGPKIHRIHSAAKAFRRLAKSIKSRLQRAYAFMPEILVENKTYTLSVHYRRVSEGKIAAAKMILLKEIGTYLEKSQAALTEGKKVWEIRPPTLWNKGKTVLFILKKMRVSIKKPLVPIYIGDDRTDESAFRALRQRGITVKVAENPKENSAANHFVRTPKDVSRFLKKLRALKTSTRPGKTQNGQ